MPTAWRQGDLLAPDDAIALGALQPAQRDSHRALVIGHSCDIASGFDVEPAVELMIGLIVPEGEATSQNGHSIRKLHLGADQGATTEWAQYGISERREVDKQRLLQYQPWSALRYPPEQRAVLRRWLAQRYARSEFPDVFINWLRESGAESKFEKLGKEFSASLVGIYFDLDDDTEREDPDEPYELGINMVYDISDASHEARAQQAAEKLKALFARQCMKDAGWRWIELIYCEAVSEESFTLRAARTFRRWRFEHRSLQGEPIDPAE
jgi:hypothetical protein